jgi:hypothetical protein
MLLNAPSQIVVDSALLRVEIFKQDVFGTALWRRVRQYFHFVVLRQCSTRIPVHWGIEMKLLSDPPTERSAEDIPFDYVDPEELRIYNDLARRIQKCFEKRESKKSKRRDRLSVKPLTNLMQE